MKTILFSILILFSINGFAFNWLKIGENIDRNSFYVDVDNIKKHNELVYYWRLVDYIQSSTPANSAISKYKVDCVEEKQTQLNATFYSQSMGKGRILFEDTPNEILYPKPKTVGYTAMKFACKNAR